MKVDRHAKSGVYAITHVPSGQQYIGASSDLPRRWSTHKSLLSLGKHHSQPLQELWSREGASAFRFELLETVPFAQLGERETCYHEKQLSEKGSRELNSPRKSSVSGIGLYRVEDYHVLPISSIPTVANCRRRLGMRREELAVHAAVPVSTIYRIETGKSKPRPAVREALAHALGLRVDEIMWPERQQPG